MFTRNSFIVFGAVKFQLNSYFKTCWHGGAQLFPEEAEADRSLGSRAAWSTDLILSQPRLQRKNLVKTNKQKTEVG